MLREQSSDVYTEIINVPSTMIYKINALPGSVYYQSLILYDLSTGYKLVGYEGEVLQQNNN